MDGKQRHCFQLIIVHSTNDGPEKRDAVRDFWSARFPQVLITNISFLTESPAWGNTGLSERALQLLREVEQGRKPTSSFGVNGILPYVFLCHELGGLLVKQALLLAQNDTKYGHIAFETALVVLYECPSPRENALSWQHDTLRLLSNSQFGSCQPSKLLHEFSIALEDVLRRFPGIDAHYTILTDSYDKVSSEDVWMPSVEQEAAERMTLKINLAIERKLRSLSQEFLDFIATLSGMDTGNYQLQLVEPSTSLLQKITEHSSYVAWRDFCPESSSILYIHSLDDGINARSASTLFFEFQKYAPWPIAATFAFNERDIRTQNMSNFYASVCRQLLLHDSKLYPRLSSIAKALLGNQRFSHKTIRNVLLTIMKACMPRPVIIMIHGAQNCSSHLVEDLTSLVDESRRSATGILKLIVLDEQSNKRFFQYSHSCCIDLGNQDQQVSFLEAFAQEETDLILQHNPQFKNHGELIFQVLFSQPYGFDRIALTAKLMMLKFERIPSTKRAIVDALQDLPTGPDSIYSAILERCRTKCKLPFDSLMMWILNAVRPLTLEELAVAVAMSSSQDMNLQDLELEMPSQIARDLQGLDGTLIKISDLQVLPAFTKFDRTTEKAKNEYNFIIFGKCMGYLKKILDIAKLHKGEAENFHEMFYSPEYGFVEYAVVEWPQHYARTNKDSKQDRVKELFNDEDSIKTWFSLYELYKGSPASMFSQLDSLLKIACWFGFADLAEPLIQQVLKTDGYETELSESLDTAAESGQEDAVTLLLNAGARSREAMHLAANGGFMSIAQKLYEIDPCLIDPTFFSSRSPLIMAVLNGDENMASYLIERGAKCNITMLDGTTPLHLAAGIGHTAIVNLLLEKNVDIQTLTAKRRNALHLAAAGGFDDISKILIRAGVKINQKEFSGMTPLHLAAEHGQASTIDILLDAGAEIDATARGGYSPIHFAAEGGFLCALRKLIQRQRGPLLEKLPTESMALTYSPLQPAAQNGHDEVVHELLQHEEYSSDKDRAALLLLAAKRGFVGVIKLLLESAITTNSHDKDGNTALHLAADGAHNGVIERLVTYKSEKSDVFDTRARNYSGWTPLHFAAKSGRLVTLKILLDHDADMGDGDKYNQTAFHIAASYGHTSVLRELSNRPDSTEKSRRLISAPDSNGNTPFLLAICNGRLDVTKYILDTVPLEGRRRSFYQGRENALTEAVRLGNVKLINLLVDYGWNINANKPRTALHTAVKAVHHGLINVLLSRGANPNVLDRESQSPIHIAAKRYPQALKTLLKDRDGVKVNIDLQGEAGCTAIWQASWAGNRIAVEQLLKQSPDLEVKNDNGQTALHAASDNPYLTKLLLDAGANPMARSNCGKTPFMFAADAGNGHLVMQHYINSHVECDFNVQDEQGRTALHMAAMNGTLQTVKLLCSINGSINASTNEGATALHYAVHSGKLEIVEYLIKKGFNINSNSNSMGTPLMSAAEMNTADAAKFLLENGAEVNLANEEYTFHSALQTAAVKNAEYMVQMFLEAGVNPNICGGEYGSPLCASVQAGNVNIARQLLEAGADIDYSKGPKGTALEYAVACGNFDLIALLLEHKADVNIASNGKHGTPLIAAIRKNSLDSVNILLEHGADANQSSLRGEKPAQAALRKGTEKIFLVLLEKGAQLAFKDRWGRGPLSTALLSRSFSLLPHLWDHADVDIDERDSVGRTPLMLSVLHGINKIQELQYRNADIDAQDNWGRTALIYAAIHEYDYMITDLVMGGAALGLKDVRGRDALYWAARQQSLSIEILKRMRHQELYYENLQHAINAAVAHNDAPFANYLLTLIDLDPFQTDDNEWTVHDTAARYKNQDVTYLIEEAAAGIKQIPLEQPLNSVKIPTQWHPLDLSPALKVSSDGTSLTVSENFKPPDRPFHPKGIALANHPMWLQEDEVYYFEIKIEHEGDGSRRFAIGFCDEHTPLGGVQLGWQKTSWGYHGEDGSTIHGGNLKGTAFGEPYGKGDVVGCGVNFAKDVAFYTLNGEIIGRAFCDIRGKLYPAISVDVRMGGCKFTARFWEGGPDGNVDFMFKGPFNDEKILNEPLKRLKQATPFSQQQEVISDSSDYSSSDLDSD